MSDRNLTQRLVRVHAGRDNGRDLLEIASGDHTYRLAAGTGTLVSGAATIATGFAVVTAFTASLNSSGDTATGATEAEQLRITSITTGAVDVGDLTHSATAAISIAGPESTANFYWIAMGR